MMAINRRNLGRTGLEISELGLGTWPLAGSGPVFSYGAFPEAEALKVLDAYVEGGGNFIDTARNYNNAETIIGKYLRQTGGRDQLVIASKTTAGEGADSLPRVDVDLETTLRELGTDYVDVLFLHFPPEDPDVMERALETMVALKQAGKIRAIGASIKGANVTAATEEMCDTYMATGHVDVLMVVYSILRQRNLSVIERAGEKGTGVVVRTVLESGLLTGAYAPGHVFAEGDHRARYDPEKLDYSIRTVEELSAFAVRPPYTALPQVAIHFSLSPPGVSSIVMGAQSPDEVRRNLSTLALSPLAPELIAELHTRYGEITEKANFDSRPTTGSVG